MRSVELYTTVKEIKLLNCWQYKYEMTLEIQIHCIIFHVSNNIHIEESITRYIYKVKQTINTL